MGTLYRQTTSIKKRVGGNWVDVALVGGVKRRTSGGWVTANAVARRTSGGWTLALSSPDVNCSGGGAAGNSGASTSGTTGVQAYATPGGTYVALSYSWERIGGNAGIYCSNANAQNPAFYFDFSGVANGTTSSPVSATWRCWVTDTETGAQAYSDLTMGNLTWTNTIPAFTPYSQTFTAGQSGSVTVPTGCGHVTIHVVGGGAQGGAGYHSGVNEDEINIWGGGASSAGYAYRYLGVSAGQSFSYSVGGAGSGPSQGGTSSCSGPSTSMAASGGYPGGNGSDGGAGQTSVGSASGGDSNYSGNTGSDGSIGGYGGGSNYGGYGAGGSGGSPFEGGGGGAGGCVVFEWGY